MVLGSSLIISWLVFVWVTEFISVIFGGKVLLRSWTRSILTENSLRTAKNLSNVTFNGIGTILLLLSIPFMGIEGGLTLYDLVIGWIILAVLTYSGTWYISKQYHSLLKNSHP